MGLDTSHDCFHGGYGRFQRFRDDVAEAAREHYGYVPDYDAHPERAFMAQGEPVEIMPVVWWCETTKRVPEHWGSRGEKAPEGNPFPCCQSRIPFADAAVEDRGCGLRPLGPRFGRG